MTVSLPLVDAPIFEPNPPWAWNPERPKLKDVRRGVLYTELELPVLRVLVEQVSPSMAWGAVGRCLFFGRNDGTWTTYDRDLIDQNEELKVRERRWPFCWGDEVWAVALWHQQPTALRWAPEGCELYVASPNGGSPSEAELIGHLHGRFAKWAEGRQVVLPLTFWKGTNDGND